MNTNLSTIQSLRDSGYKVRVAHYRVYHDGSLMTRYVASLREALDNDKPVMVGRGGVTQVKLTRLSDKKSSIGTAICSKKDQYCKKSGVRLALARALTELMVEV